MKLPKEPPVQSPFPETPAAAAAKMKGEFAMWEVGEPGPSVVVVAAAAATEAIESEEQKGREETEVNLFGVQGAELGRLPLLLLLSLRLLLPLVAPLLLLVVVLAARWNGCGPLADMGGTSAGDTAIGSGSGKEVEEKE